MAGVDGLTGNTTASNGEESQFKPPSGLTGPGGQNELICVLKRKTKTNV